MPKAKRTDYGFTAKHIKKLGFKFMKASGSRKLDKSIAYDSDGWGAILMTNGKYFLHDPMPGDPRPYAMEYDKAYLGELENALLCDLQWLTEKQFHKKAAHLLASVPAQHEFSVDEIADAIQLMETLDE